MQPPKHSTPWVFLRGLTRGSGHWGRFIAEFEAAMPGAKVVALDMAGNGTRYAEKSATTVTAMVEDCRAQLQLLGIAAPYDVLAVSLGGMVAAQWALMWPDEVERMVLMGTSMRPLSPFYERLRPANYLPLLQLLFGASPEHWEQEILRMTTRHPPYDVLTDWVQLRQRNPVSAANALRQLIAAARFSLPTAMAMEPQSAAKPVLLLAGEGDGLVSAKCTSALASHWNCEAVLHPTAGHDVTLDDGPWVAAQVRRSVLI